MAVATSDNKKNYKKLLLEAAPSAAQKLDNSLQRTKKRGNNERKRREWFRSVTTLNLAANPINNDYIVYTIAEYAKNIVDIRSRDDISGACPIARGNYDITTLMDLSDTAYSRYASKCVATF